MPEFVLWVTFSYCVVLDGVLYTSQSTGFTVGNQLNPQTDYRLSDGISPMITALDCLRFFNIKCVGLKVFSRPYEISFWGAYDKADKETKGILLREWLPYA